MSEDAPALVSVPEAPAIDESPPEEPAAPRRRTAHTENMRVLRRMVLPVVAEEPHWRPRVRGECIDGPRPCPYVGCRHHLALEVDPTNGHIRFVTDDPTTMEESCSLDIADRGGAILDELAGPLRMTRERVRQIQEKTLAKLERQGAIRALRGSELDRRSNWDVIAVGNITEGR